MKNKTIRMTYVVLILLAVFLMAVAPGRVDAAVVGPTDITIKKACISMPDGTVTAPTGTPAITCPAGTIVMWLPYDNVGAAYLAPGGFNANAGFFFMQHSHSEKELTNFDIFPGGMATFLIVEPPSAPVQ